VYIIAWGFLFNFVKLHHSLWKQIFWITWEFAHIDCYMAGFWCFILSIGEVTYPWNFLQLLVSLYHILYWISSLLPRFNSFSSLSGRHLYAVLGKEWHRQLLLVFFKTSFLIILTLVTGVFCLISLALCMTLQVGVSAERRFLEGFTLLTSSSVLFLVKILDIF
jgi:hypothetical protein